MYTYTQAPPSHEAVREIVVDRGGGGAPQLARISNAIDALVGRSGPSRAITCERSCDWEYSTAASPSPTPTPTPAPALADAGLAVLAPALSDPTPTDRGGIALDSGRGA